jgi:hypothetical protein
MTEIQKIYDERMAALTPAERMARVSAMLKWTRDFIARQILEEEPDCGEELLKLKVAARMYGSQPQVMALIQQEIERVSARSV